MKSVCESSSSRKKKDLFIHNVRFQWFINKCSCSWLVLCARIESCEPSTRSKRKLTETRRCRKETWAKHKRRYMVPLIHTREPKINKFQLKQNNYVDDVTIESRLFPHFTAVCMYTYAGIISELTHIRIHYSDQSLFAISMKQSTITNFFSVFHLMEIHI